MTSQPLPANSVEAVVLGFVAYVERKWLGGTGHTANNRWVNHAELRKHAAAFTEEQAIYQQADEQCPFDPTAAAMQERRDGEGEGEPAASVGGRHPSACYDQGCVCDLNGPAMIPLPDPNGGCICTPYSQDAGGGYTEHLAEYEPACPVHSEHVCNPRTGVWDLARTPTLADEGLRSALTKRTEDWFHSTSETYLQPVGSDAWIAGLIGYLINGPGALTALLADEGLAERLRALHIGHHSCANGRGSASLYRGEYEGDPCPTIALLADDAPKEGGES